MHADSKTRPAARTVYSCCVLGTAVYCALTNLDTIEMMRFSSPLQVSSAARQTHHGPQETASAGDEDRNERGRARRNSARSPTRPIDAATN